MSDQPRPEEKKIIYVDRPDMAWFYKHEDDGVILINTAFEGLSPAENTS